jgi:MYXO-CTERM domain-containing protein
MKVNAHLVRLLAAVAGAVMLAASAQAALVGRDINGNAVAGDAASSVFLYDTDRKITWLRDANAGAGSTFDNGGDTTDGRMTWANAVAWADALTVGAFDDWRLPTALNADGSGPCGPAYNCTGSEMGHLWYTALGNTAGAFTNDGDFLNMQSDAYWSGTEFAPDPNNAWLFSTGNGNQFALDKNFQFYAMAVRPGDVLAAQVPEPESRLLALTGLGALALVRRRRAVGSSAP